MTDAIFTDARIVLPEEIVEGTLAIRDGRVHAVSSGGTRAAGEKLDGDYLVPGLVELHTDHLENHYHPRPGVAWPAVSAVMAHDAQIAAAGITTVFDALRAGTFDPGDLSAHHARTLSRAIRTAQEGGQLRAEHFIHLRCELPCPDTADSAASTAEAGPLHLVSLMDHTPGARQFVSIDKFKEYYLGKKIIAPEKMDAYIEERRGLQEAHAARNKRVILDLARSLGVRLASHDDATEAHVAEAVSDGASIAEFPTTRDAAKAAHGQGLAVLMGAPNVVRGKSHSGNISAAEVAAENHLDILSSDYVPASLLPAVFHLANTVEGMSLPKAMRLITLNPARAAGLDDRGALEQGLRGDVVQVRMVDGLPIVRRVWRQGVRVL